MIFCVCLRGIMENDVTCHGKVIAFYYQISVGTLQRTMRDWPDIGAGGRPVTMDYGS